MSVRTTVTVATLLTALCGTTAAGCGDDTVKPHPRRSSHAVATTTAARSPSNDRTFRDSANRLCAAAGAAITQQPKLTRSNLSENLGAQARIVSALVTKLRALEPPPAQAAGFRSFVDATAREAADLHEVVAAVESGKASLAKQHLNTATSAARRSNDQARVLGLSDCAKDYEAGGGSRPQSS